MEQRRAFWSFYKELSKDEESHIIIFYGAGGVGKTFLINELEKEFKAFESGITKKCAYIKYDFNRSTDTREILNEFKFQLAAYGCTFPLFDTGNYYYLLKTGQDITPPKAKSMMERIPWLNEIKKNLLIADDFAGKSAPVLSTAKMFFDLTDDVLRTIPITKTIMTCFSVLDTLLVKYMEKTQVLDADHKKLRDQLNSCFQDRNPSAIYEYLPTLFAQDVADWLKATGKKLIVLLDNYELLISETGLATAEQLKHDLWLRGDKGLIFMIPNTLWAIAGRNMIRWDGELADELDQHLIKALSPSYSDYFLRMAGIQNETLRGELVRLTEGYPIFLDLCVDVYTAYKRRNNTEPTIDEFGQKRQDVVARIFRYLDEDKDDAAKDMLEFLCVLNVWTDDIAVDIGKQVLQNFSSNTYKRVKEFSFIQTECLSSEDADLTVYRFDRTIQSILFSECDKRLVEEVKTATEDYFKKFFEFTSSWKPFYFFYLTMWADCIVRCAANAEELREQYDNIIAHQLRIAKDGIEKFHAAEKILNLFMSKLEQLGETDSLVCAYCEQEMGFTKKSQGEYESAYSLMNSAYEKFLRLLGAEHPETIRATIILANALYSLGRHEEELPLREKVLAAHKKIYGAEEIDTLWAMRYLADTLCEFGRYDESLALNEQLLSILEKISDDDKDLSDFILSTKDNMATALYRLGRFKEVAALKEDVAEGRREDLLKIILTALSGMNDLADMLIELGRYGKALELQEKVLVFCIEIFGERHLNTLAVVDKLVDMLNTCGRQDEASTLKEEVLSGRKEIADTAFVDTLLYMGKLNFDLADCEGCENHKNCDDSENCENFEDCKDCFYEALDLSLEVSDIMTATDLYAEALRDCESYEAALHWQRQSVVAHEKLYGENHPLTTEAMGHLAILLNACGKREEALEMLNRAAASATEILGNKHPLVEELNRMRDTILNENLQEDSNG